MEVSEITLALYEILKAGGFTTGGINFDAKIRRQSIDPDDLLHAHVGSMDATVLALLNAATLLENASLEKHVSERYSGWDKISVAQFSPAKRVSMIWRHTSTTAI
jgi:xylose isomerase